MPRYYCDYCDTYLTHDSPSVRKQHNAGYKHKANVRTYYQQFEEQQTQSLIDQRIKEHLGQAAALQQVGAAYAAWRARGPVPMMPMPGLPPGAPLGPGIRPPVLPRPMGAPLVYGAPPPMAPPPISGQQGMPTGPMPTNGPPGHPAINMPASAPGATTNPGPGGAPAGGAQPMYQGPPGGPNYGSAPNMSAPPSFPNTSNADSFSFSPAPNNSNQ